MYATGHFGLTLLITSLIMIPFGYNENGLILIVLSALLSTLPDIDLEWQKSGLPIHHRGPTHSLSFAILAGIIIGGLFFWTHKTLLWVGLGFLSAFVGVLCHLIGDSFTYHSFKPLWPFSEKEIAFGLFGANNKAVNEGLLTVGGLAFIFYFLLARGSLSI